MLDGQQCVGRRGGRWRRRVASDHRALDGRQPAPFGAAGARRTAQAEHVAQTVADDVEREDRERDRGAGDEQLPRRFVQRPGIRVGEHPPPGRGRRTRSETQEAQARFRQERARDTERRRDQQRRPDIRQDPMAEDSASVAASGARRLDERFFTHDERGAAHQTRQTEHEHDRQRQDHVPRARAENAGHRQREHERREAQPTIGNSHQHAVEPAAGVPGHEPEHEADRHRDHDHRQAHAQ